MNADTIDADRRDDDRAEAKERLRVLGDLLARGWQTQRDLDEVRALPGPYAPICGDTHRSSTTLCSLRVG